jgi:hypothetical protein
MYFSIFSSRTFWTIVVMFIVGGGNAIDPVLPTIVQVPLLTILSGLATYFHVNPSQTYNPPQQ